MKRTHTIFLLLVLFIFVGSGCDKDNPVAPGSVSERIETIVAPMNVFGENDNVSAIAVDANENLYAFDEKIVYQITPTGEKLQYGTHNLNWAEDMKMGPGGNLYISIGSTDLYIIPPGGGAVEPYLRLPDEIRTFDFNSDKTLYAVGGYEGIYTYNPVNGIVSTGSFRHFTINCLKIYNNCVYVGGTNWQSNISGVWRAKILPATGELSDEELVFYWGYAGDFATSWIYSLTFSSRGDMLIGTNNLRSVLVVPPDGDYYPRENIYPLFSDTLSISKEQYPPQNKIVWSDATNLYILRSHYLYPSLRSLLKVDVALNGAPYFGRSLPETGPSQEKPVITAIDPPNSCSGGVNLITIKGSNFFSNPESFSVYFDGIQANIKSVSSTEIVVYRPDIVSDSVKIIVENVSDGRLFQAEHSPYKITQVIEPYGIKYQQIQLNALAIDNSEYLYAIQSTPRTIFQISAEKEISQLGEASRNVTDAKIGPNGWLYMLMNNKYINIFDVAAFSFEETEWVRLSERASYGDFDQNGNFYTGGRRSGLIVVQPDLNQVENSVYSDDEIFCIRVFNGHVFALVEHDNPVDGVSIGIWRHKILDATGSLGDQELVLDWGTTGEFANSEPTGFTFSANGTIVIVSEHEHPVLLINPDNSQEILYKDILNEKISKVVWGNFNYLYLIIDDYEHSIYKVDMGTTGAPYYGRNL